MTAVAGSDNITQNWLLICVGFALTPFSLFSFANLAGLGLGRDLAEWARHDSAHEITRSVFVAVELYHRDHQQVPKQEDGMAALVPRFMRIIPRDPWDRPLVYKAQGGEWADIISLGADGSPGGQGVATDISARYGSPGTSSPSYLNLVLVLFLALIPAAAYAAAYVQPAGVSLLIGLAAFWGWAVSVTIAPDADLSITLVATSVAVVTAIAGALLCLRGLPGGPTCALVGTLACQFSIAWIIGTVG